MEKKKKNYSLTVVIVFLIFIFAIGILYIALPKKSFSETEKRYLAEFPDFSVQALVDGDFTKDFETYLSDHTPLREFFVSVNAYFELAKGNNGSAGVYLGKDGWLIEKPIKRDNRLEQNLKTVLTFSETCKLPSTLLLVPTKGSVYADYLPKGAMEYYDDKYIDTAAGLCDGKIKFIDIRPEFNSLKNSEQLFYKTDHHWTSAGAFAACNVIFKELGLKSINAVNYDFEVTPGFYGTSYSTSCYTFTKPDQVEVRRNKNTHGKAKVTIEEGGKTEIFDNMFFDEALDTGDKYVVYLNGNHALEKIETGNEGGRLLLIKDSFAHCAAPFLAENYSEIIMVDLRYYKKPVSELITENGITEIMYFYGLDTFADSRDIIFR